MRLVAAIESASALDASDNEHNTIVCGLNEANNVTHHMRSYQGFTGETGDQIDAWTDTTMKQVQGIKENHNTAMEYYVEARRAMTHIREEAQQLSPTLIDSNLQKLADMTHVAVPVTEYLGPFGGPINTLAVSADAYFQALIAQANAQREVAATDILERANNTMQGLADGISAQTQQLDDPGAHQWPGQGPSIPSVRHDIENGYLNVSPHAPGVYPGDRDSGYGRSDLRGTGSGLYSDGYDEGGPVSGRVMSSPRIPNEYITEGEVGSRLNPITDPQDLMGMDLLHTRVNGDRHANGTVGGYTPAPPVDRYHPLWNVNGGPGSESALAARMGGAGVLGAGAVGMGAASRLGAGGLSALGRTGASGASGSGLSGAAALRAGSYSGPGYGTYKAPAAGGAGAGAGGTTAAPGSSAAKTSASGGAGQGSARGAGGFMGGAGAGGAGGKDDKKKSARRKYTPFRFDDDGDGLPEGYVNPMSQTYGSDKDLSPAPRKDDGWDPRQW
jgi:PE_PGRS family protein